jgi:hypothetical protein
VPSGVVHRGLRNEADSAGPSTLAAAPVPATVVTCAQRVPVAARMQAWSACRRAGMQTWRGCFELHVTHLLPTRLHHSNHWCRTCPPAIMRTRLLFLSALTVRGRMTHSGYRLSCLPRGWGQPMDHTKD